MSKSVETRNQRNPNIAIGTHLIVMYRGERFSVERTADGYELNGTMFDTLSQCACVIRGYSTSAILFGVLHGKFDLGIMGKRVTIVKPDGGVMLPAEITALTPANTPTKTPANIKDSSNSKSAYTGQPYKSDPRMKITGRKPSKLIEVRFPRGNR